MELLSFYDSKNMKTSRLDIMKMKQIDNIRVSLFVLVVETVLEKTVFASTFQLGKASCGVSHSSTDGVPRDVDLYPWTVIDSGLRGVDRDRAVQVPGQEGRAPVRRSVVGEADARVVTDALVGNIARIDGRILAIVYKSRTILTSRCLHFTVSKRISAQNPIKLFSFFQFNIIKSMNNYNRRQFTT